MISSDEEFHEWLLGTFREEADEILTEMSKGLISLENDKAGNQAELIEQVFRKTHSLKGAARAVNLREIESICQNIENVFSALKREEIEPDPGIFDLLHRSISAIYTLLSPDPPSELLSTEIVYALRSALSGKNSPVNGVTQSGPLIPDTIPNAPVPDDDPEIPSVFSTDLPVESVPENSNLLLADELVSPSEQDTQKHAGRYAVPLPVQGIDTVRISSHKLDQLISGSDDLLTTRLFIAHRLREIEDMMSAFSLWKWNHSQIEGDLHQIREFTYGIQKSNLPPDILLPLERIIDFLKFDHDFVSSLQHDLSRHIHATEMDRSALEASTSEISDLIHDAVLLPISTILSPFYKFVRDYSRSTGKIVDLRIEGEDLEMDRRILESLKPVLMHLIHNCIDHGFATPDVRIQRGKPESGIIHVRITPHSGSKVSIDVIDDGAGIDLSGIRKAAVERGVITVRQEPHLTDEEALWLIFRSGLSTCREVTELSGRGLGLAIVEDTVSRLGGDVMISSFPLKGTTITIVLPVRLATFRGVVVRSGGQTYVLPLQQVKQVIRAVSNSFLYQGSRLVARIDGETVRVVMLTHALGMQGPGPIISGPDPVPIVTLEYGGRQIACVVDEVIRVQEIVVRPLGSLLKRVKRITGAVILGDGRVAMVLDPLELIQEAFTTGRPSQQITENFHDEKRILVVEDSVTSRALLKRTLEMEGYLVQTATDGMDAFAKLKDYEFDMVVSDVDMPRMSGFTLTEKIRADDNYTDLAVVLVTSLDSQEDQEHGKAVGADAYVVKSSFEKCSFLKTIRDLLSGKR
ncbi:MAG: response regulator [Methanospirillum sp.]|uniref:hybrid sensor histidine kinase/response regulator n=1 Tax=Methanospirillum sp. TaxID=45200 RepID=UPI0023754F57|nr:chemotaxis protein CheW [Methanospirillum sp.]MDD1730212.1 response regulator [Methanospirillum sp.]